MPPWAPPVGRGRRLYDGEGKGFLAEEELEAYVRDQVLTMEGLPDVQDKFLDFYVHTAVRKLAFFVESSRPGARGQPPLRGGRPPDPRVGVCACLPGRIPIGELLRSEAFEEFSRLRSPELAEEDQADNWFTHGNAMRVYRQYLDLDLDHNGMLTARELRNYGARSVRARRFRSGDHPHGRGGASSYGILHLGLHPARV